MFDTYKVSYRSMPATAKLQNFYFVKCTSLKIENNTAIFYNINSTISFVISLDIVLHIELLEDGEKEEDVLH